MKILVIDDEALMRKTISRMLARSGHEAVCIESPLQVVDAINQNQFDAAVVDVNLADGVDGIELARDIRNLRPASYFICMFRFFNSSQTEGLAFLTALHTDQLCAGYWLLQREVPEVNAHA